MVPTSWWHHRLSLKDNLWCTQWLQSWHHENFQFQWNKPYFDWYLVFIFVNWPLFTVVVSSVFPGLIWNKKSSCCPFSESTDSGPGTAPETSRDTARIRRNILWGVWHCHGKKAVAVAVAVAVANFKTRKKSFTMDIFLFIQLNFAHFQIGAMITFCVALMNILYSWIICIA